MTERVVTNHDREFKAALRLLQEANVYPGRDGYTATQLRQELETYAWEPSEDEPDGHPGVAVRAIRRRRAPVFGSDTIRRRGSDPIVAWVVLLADAISRERKRSGGR